MAILETHDLGKRYGRRTWALRHVDLEVPDGSVNLVIPGERYRFVEAREAAVLIGGSLVALLLAGCRRATPARLSASPRTRTGSAASPQP